MWIIACLSMENIPFQKNILIITGTKVMCLTSSVACYTTRLNTMTHTLYVMYLPAVPATNIVPHHWANTKTCLLTHYKWPSNGDSYTPSIIQMSEAISETEIGHTPLKILKIIMISILIYSFSFIITVIFSYKFKITSNAGTPPCCFNHQKINVFNGIGSAPIDTASIMPWCV